MKKTSNKLTEKKTITLRSDIVQKLDAQAEEENRSFSNMLETAALTYLKHNGTLQM
ncbi:hypothetical protein MTsPCn5_17900 [Croceitalea sp. MTPC5]|uniref:hypothetical protein n=1 Tax=Croceitalea sp. MTPC5 TaxID=3056565 RepID=UPI002B3EB50D|nr:hypothetical protein MTsPCn5_17900 [Croceitalea sp. MTPC5]